MPRISTIEFTGKQQTFDLEVEHHDHQYYLSNGILQSNSHAVAYAIDSYYAAWLHTHYETDWLATILQSENGNPSAMSKAISEIKSFGYEIAPADINYSGLDWQYSDELQAFVPPLTSLKGVGDKAVDEIFENRPYRNLDDLFFTEEGDWKHSKLNKTAFNTLCKMEALSSLKEIKEGILDNHRQLFEMIISNYERLRKGRYGITKTQQKRALANGEKLIPVVDDIMRVVKTVADWNRTEKIQNYMDLSNDASIDLLFPQSFVDKVAKKNVESVFKIPGGEKGIGWFCVLETIKKKTKNGKDFLRLKVTDNENNTGWVRVWGTLEDDINYTLWLSEVHNDASWGMSTSLRKMKLINAFE